MKICRFTQAGAVFTGLFSDSTLTVCDETFNATDQVYAADDVELLAPVTPSKIVCVGRNYADHAAELGNAVPKEPLLFLKAPSAIVAHGADIQIPYQSSQVEHEGELAVVIRQKCSHLTADENTADYILGYTCLNDVTARDVQRHDVQFTRGKSFDTFCPIGPYIETTFDPTDVRVQTLVNGEVRQDGSTAQMVFPVEFLVRYISQQMTLLPGDVIATGTPAGVSKMESGDVCEVRIEGLATLRNTIR